MVIRDESRRRVVRWIHVRGGERFFILNMTQSTLEKHVEHYISNMFDISNKEMSYTTAVCRGIARRNDDYLLIGMT